MTFGQHDYSSSGGLIGAGRSRPAWLPHPGLIAFIAALWALAVVCDAAAWLRP